MPDYYLEDPTRLQGQPKRTIADYVGQNGILVPRRFDSLEEATASGKEVLLRSEHPQDYAGVSGLLDSFDLNKVWVFKDLSFTAQSKYTLEEIKNGYFDFQEKSSGIPKFKEYCRYMKKNEEILKAEVSFSLWEKIPGFNRIVVADSAVQDRYHIMTSNSLEFFRNYTIVENGKIIKQFIAFLPDTLREGINNLLETYEAVRNLDRFDPHHCPIMEFQTWRGRNYFLQYHRTRDFTPTQFTLERETKEDENEVPFVRGATPPEGLHCKVTLYYANAITGDFDPNDEDGSYDLHWYDMWKELRVRQRKVQMINTDNIDFLLEGVVINHYRRSNLFKPQVSIIHDIKELLHDYKNYKKKGKNTFLHLQIISDGRRAFVKLDHAE